MPSAQVGRPHRVEQDQRTASEMARDDRFVPRELAREDGVRLSAAAGEAIRRLQGAAGDHEGNRHEESSTHG